MKISTEEGDLSFVLEKDVWSFSITGMQRWYHYSREEGEDDENGWWNHFHGRVEDGKCLLCERRMPEEIRIQGELQKLSRSVLRTRNPRRDLDV